MDSYFCASGSSGQIWPRRPSPGCDILTGTSSRARRSRPRPETQKQSVRMKREGEPIRNRKTLVLLFVTLTPATRTPSADFTTFLKKSSSFSFLFFPRTLSCQRGEVKGHAHIYNMEHTGLHLHHHLSSGEPQPEILTSQPDSSSNSCFGIEMTSKVQKPFESVH